VSDEITPPPDEGTPAPAGKSPRSRTKTPRPPAKSPRPRPSRPQAGGQSDSEIPQAAGEGTPAPAAKSPRPRAKTPRPPARSSRAPAKSARPPTEVSSAPAGQIAGYRLEEQIGQGGMAVVYRARDERLDRRVALKLLAPAVAADAAFRQRFIRESRAAAAVDHPNIIPIYEAGDAGGSLFIAMRYVQGGDVRSLLERGGPLSGGRAWSIITQVAAALDAAHEHGLVHRDVKPANMLLDASARTAGQGRGFLPDDKPEHVYLSDFGISKQSLSASSITGTGQFVGTLDYIAPEQIDGRDVDGRADQYSLGCAAFELLSGAPPFRREQALAMITAHLAEPPPRLAARRGDLRPAVDSVLAGAMAKSPGERYPTCAQFAADLGRALGLVPGEPEPHGTQRAGFGPAMGDRARPWPPATAIGGQVPGPGAAPAGNVTPGGQRDIRPPQVLPGVPPAAAGSWQAAGGSRQAAGPPKSPGPATRYSGPQDPGGQWPAQPAGPYGSYGPYGPGATGRLPQAPPRRSRGMIAAVIVAVAAVAVAAGAAALVIHNRNSPSAGSPPAVPVSSTSTSPSHSASPSPSPSPSPSAQAAAISNLLTSGATSSTVLTDAVDKVQACTNLPGSVRQIQQVRDQRQTEYNQAKALSTSALQNGAVLKSDLTKALFYSLTADSDYLAWAQQQESACQAGSQSGAALTADSQAVNYKTLFVNMWNPVAAQYGLPATSVSSM
jgi:serine/threonine protein kinase